MDQFYENVSGWMCQKYRDISFNFAEGDKEEKESTRPKKKARVAY
jgi:hypothetical protein